MTGAVYFTRLRCLYFFVIVLHSSYTSPTCGPDEDQCSDGKCIKKVWNCDGDEDCSDGADEASCSPVRCAVSEYMCADKTLCIPQRWVCDGEADCEDDSDEMRCTAMFQSTSIATTLPSSTLSGVNTEKSTCMPGRFECGNGKCIPDRWVCDKQHDCLDNSDEIDCGQTTCGPKSFPCISGQCIPKTWRCNGQSDCMDGTDEVGCPSLSTRSESTTTSPTILKSTSTLALTSTSTTKSTTTTTATASIAPTLSGKLVSEEGESFSGSSTKTEEDPKVMAISMKDLHIIDLTTNEVQVEPLADEVSRAVPIALDVDVRNRKLYWTDKTFTNINTATFSENFTLLEARTLYFSGVQNPKGIALDWIHQNLYWSDASAKKITVASLETGEKKTLIDTDLETVMGLAVDPINGWLYWTSYGRYPKIEMSGTDGSQRAVLYRKGLKLPVDVALDYNTNKLYWCDEDTRVIGVCFLTSRRCKTLFKSTTPAMIFSLDIYKNHLYWTELVYGQIQRLNRKIVKNVRSIQKDVIGLKGIVIFHSDRQPDANNRCKINNGGCQICLPSPNGSNTSDSFVCACPDVQNLQNDTKTCDIKDPLDSSPCFLGYELQGNRCVDVDECVTQPDSCSQICVNTPGSFICSCQEGYTLENKTRCKADGDGYLIVLDLRDFKRINLTTYEYESLIVPKTVGVTNPTSLDFDVKRETMFWADSYEHTINVAKIVKNQLKSPEELVANEEGVSGLAYDWVHRLLYWTKDKGHKAIKVIDVRRRLISTIVSGNLGKPRGIVVDPARGWLYWTNWDKPASIEKCGMDGTRRHTLVSTNIQWPNGITIDYVNKRLYWGDAFFDHVTSSDLNGNDLRIIVDKTSFAQEHMYAMTIFEDYVYWTDWMSETVRQMNKATGERTFHQIHGRKLYDIKVFHIARQPKEKNRCGQFNHGCQLCLPSHGFNDYKCACADGQKLQLDQRTCVKLDKTPSKSCFLGYRLENGTCFDEDECTATDTCSHTCVNTPGSFRCTCPEDFVLVNDTQCVLRESVPAVLLAADTRTLKRVDLSSGLVWTIPLANTSSQSRATALDYDLRTKTVYWTDYRETGIYSAVLNDDLTLTRKRKLNLTGIYDPQGLALDWIHNNLYWSDLSARTLLVTSLDTGVQKTLLSTGLSYIRGLAVDPRYGWLYWASWGKDPSISRVGMDGSQRTVLIERGLDTPNDVAIDYSTDRLYWIDGWATKLGSCDLNGNACRIVWSTEEKLMLFSIAVFQNSVYWTERRQAKVRRFNLTSGEPMEVVIDGVVEPAGVVVSHPDTQPYARDRCSHAYRDGCQICLPSPEGANVDFRCACPDGLYFQRDGRTCGDKDPFSSQCPPGFRLVNGTCLDIDECETLGKCSQICVNTYGSYSCKCRFGYDLENGLCVQSKDAFLIMSQSYDFRLANLTSFDFEEMRMSNRFRVQRPLSLDFDIANSRMYWSDIYPGSINMATVEGIRLTNPGVLVEEGARSVQGLTFDWIHKLLFWVDAAPDIEVIRVRSLLTNSTKTLISDLGRPRAITVHPKRRMIFWTNWAKRATIERCGMDGENRNIIIYDQIKWPNGITIDYDTEIIYWTDARLKTLSSCNIDGSNRRIIVSKSSFPREHFFSITQYRDYVYWSDWSIPGLRRANKVTGQNITSFPLRTQQFDVKIYHPSRQKQGENVCGEDNGGCSHLCLPSVSRGFRCQCPDKWLLRRDDKTCFKRSE